MWAELVELAIREKWIRISRRIAATAARGEKDKRKETEIREKIED